VQVREEQNNKKRGKTGEQAGKYDIAGKQRQRVREMGDMLMIMMTMTMMMMMMKIMMKMMMMVVMIMVVVILSSVP
jgi:hypothetical protein